MERAITTQTVEARAFFGGARKVRYFDTVQEADEWLIQQQQRFAGMTRDIIEHNTTLGISAAKAQPAAVEFVPQLDAAREAVDRD